ncbi:glutamate-rich protein 2 isoform X1 [Hemicordylus capensis]|uniref:glutamate-rich protein 2 isoform X1 n=1 Tax=Hemicordylus capensis TaxID=884348 RepID=UPI0023046506|nr:glutamate-rich protein 2 isoform X1 [Hemicordylus capensis]
MNRFNLVLGQGIPRPAAPKVSGMMEVIAPEDGFILETCLPLSRHSSLGWTDAMKEQKNRQNGRLHVFGPKEVIIEPVQTVSRMGSGNESTSRPYTPSKQILLCAAKSSLKKRNALTRIVKHKNPKTSVRLHDHIEEEADICNDQQLKTDLPGLNYEIKIIETKTDSDVNDEEEKKIKNVEKTANSGASTDTQEESIKKDNAEEKPSDSSADDDDDDNEQSNNEVKKRSAPLELMGEFLKAIMERNYSLAKKLCQMILIYEPENPEAKQFLPLIERKLVLESERRAEEGEETDEGSSDDSEESTSNTDKSGTDSEASSRDSDDND